VKMLLQPEVLIHVIEAPLGVADQVEVPYSVEVVIMVVPAPLMTAVYPMLFMNPRHVPSNGFRLEVDWPFGVGEGVCRFVELCELSFSLCLIARFGAGVGVSASEIGAGARFAVLRSSAAVRQNRRMRFIRAISGNYDTTERPASLTRETAGDTFAALSR
jgi:hypothetical protein